MSADAAALPPFKKLPYKPDTDFTYIGTIGRFPVALVVNPSFPARNLTEFVAQAKAQGDKLSYASPGNGSLAARRMKSPDSRGPIARAGSGSPSSTKRTSSRSFRSR